MERRKFPWGVWPESGTRKVHDSGWWLNTRQRWYVLSHNSRYMRWDGVYRHAARMPKKSKAVGLRKIYGSSPLEAIIPVVITHQYLHSVIREVGFE